jgi:microsomal dipeptidase-like Zn-dependent dipeptidase
MAQRLLDRGVSENIVEDIFWNNALGVMKRAVHNHTR